MSSWALVQYAILVLSSLIVISRTQPAQDVCQLNKKVGPCRAAFRRYYFDTSSGLCKRFIYGGCRGNGNNFRSIAACKKTCKEQTSLPGVLSVCQLNKKVGPCRAAIRRYYFDTMSGLCTRFIYGGCRGNGNNFRSIAACKKTCKEQISLPDVLSVCQLNKKVGPCRAAFPRYYFDTGSGLCKHFIYGGCRGNSNNFRSIAACKKTCGCKAPAKTGVCFAYFERYFFDEAHFQKTGKCSKFIYGGCGANENNFRNNRSCLNTCTIGKISTGNPRTDDN